MKHVWVGERNRRLSSQLERSCISLRKIYEFILSYYFLFFHSFISNSGIYNHLAGYQTWGYWNKDQVLFKIIHSSNIYELRACFVQDGQIRAELILVLDLKFCLVVNRAQHLVITGYFISNMNRKLKFFTKGYSTKEIRLTL